MLLRLLFRKLPDSTPVIKTKLKRLNFPKEIKTLTAKECKLRRKWHQSRNPHDKNQKHQSSINNFFTELTTESSTEYSLWQVTKYLKRPIAQVPS
jgi:hypothetical protein